MDRILSKPLWKLIADYVYPNCDHFLYKYVEISYMFPDDNLFKKEKDFHCEMLKSVDEFTYNMITVLKMMDLDLFELVLIACIKSKPASVMQSCITYSNINTIGPYGGDILNKAIKYEYFGCPRTNTLFEYVSAYAVIMLDDLSFIIKNIGSFYNILHTLMYIARLSGRYSIADRMFKLFKRGLQ